MTDSATSKPPSTIPQEGDQFVAAPHFNFEPTENPELLLKFSDREVVRRHSISLMNRTPPLNSLAADILGSHTPSLALSRTNLMFNDIKDLADRLSDFNSCVSELSSSEDADHECEGENKGWVTMNEQKRKRRLKRKNSLTPNKEIFLKKQNTDLVPDF